LGTAIAARRKQNDLSPAVLAERAGSTIGRLEAIEAGAAEATLGELRRMADVLDVDLPQLIQEGEMREP
jgi:transcriptional regulator with XRE-family HTH domain